MERELVLILVQKIVGALIQMTMVGRAQGPH